MLPLMLLCACLPTAAGPPGQTGPAPIERIYAKRYSENPNDARSAHILGLATWARGDVQAARAWFAQAARLAPDTLAGAHAHAMALAQTGDTEGAVRLLRAIAQQKKAPWDIWFDLGHLLLRVHAAQAAADAFARAALLAPRSVVAQHDAGIAYLHMGDLEAAGDALARALLLAPEFAPSRHAQGVLAALAGHESEALAVMGSGRGDVAAWAYNTGVVAMGTGDFVAASQAYEQAAWAAPPWAQAHTNLGVMQDLLSDDAAAADNFLWAAALPQAGDAGAYNLGLAYFRAGDLAAARDTLEATVRQDPHDAEAWLHLGEVYFQLGVPSRAYSALEAAAMQTRRSPPPMAVALAPASQAPVAAVAAGPAHASAADKPPMDPKVALARSYLARGQAAEAIALLEPRNGSHAKDAAWDTVLGLAYRSQGRMDRAAHWLERATHDGAPEAVAFFNWGVTLLDAARLADARRALLQAVRLDAGMAEAYYFLAVIAQRSGRKSEALSQARIARRLDVHHEEARRLIDSLTLAP